MQEYLIFIHEYSMVRYILKIIVFSIIRRKELVYILKRIKKLLHF